MDEQRKTESIEYILSRGLAKPQSSCAKTAEILRRMGFRSIFHDMGYSIFFAALSLAAVITLFALAPDNYRYSAAVACAPMLFLLMSLFTESSERASGLYELKQTCCCTVAQIGAVRVICYSPAAALFTGIIAALSAESLREFLSLFPICLLSLFLCAVLEMTILRLSRGYRANIIFAACWVTVNTLLPLSLGDTWESALCDLPVAVSAALALVGIIVFARRISKMLAEERNYAAA